MPGDFYHTFCYDACAHVVPKDYAHIATQSAVDKLTNYYDAKGQTTLQPGLMHQ